MSRCKSYFIAGPYVSCCAFYTLLLIVLIIVAIIIAAFLYIRRRRSRTLRKEFGPEYKRALNQYGDQRKAEAELAARQERVSKLEIHELTHEEQIRFSDAWRKTQARFVDDPSRGERSE